MIHRTCAKLGLLALMVLTTAAWGQADAQDDAAAAAAPDSQGAETVALPAAADRIVPAGGGQYLLLQMNRLLKVAVFDMGTGKIAGYIPLSSNDTIIAGTMEHVVLVARDKGVIQRWSLSGLKKELTLPIGDNAEIDGLVAGYASQGPLLLMTRQGPTFLSLKTLKPITFQMQPGRGDWSPHPQYGISVAASADGTTFAGWVKGVSPSGVRVLRINGQKLQAAYEHDTAGALYPSWDGSFIFTGQGIYSSDLKRIDAARLQGMQCIPALHPSYFIGISRPDLSPRPGGKSAVSLYTTGERTLLFKLPEMPELAGDDARFVGFNATDMSQSLFFSPRTAKLVTLPRTRDRLLLRKFDLVAELKRAGIDYLYVDSVPPTTAEAGKPYEYQISVTCKNTPPKLSLDSGPEGMKISAAGKITWSVPADYESGDVGVIVTIQDSAGQSLFHTYSIKVAGKEPPAPARSAAENPDAAAPAPGMTAIDRARARAMARDAATQPAAAITAVDRARAARAATQPAVPMQVFLQSARSQIELYFLHHGERCPDFAKYPGADQLLSRTTPDGTVDANGQFGPYMQRVVPNPLNGLQNIAGVDDDVHAGYVLRKGKAGYVFSSQQRTLLPTSRDGKTCIQPE